MEEIWKEIPGLDNYLVSNYGRVKGLPIKTNFGKRIKYYPERILKTKTSNKLSYHYISTSEKGKIYRKLLHRVVAICFLPNPNNYPVINHKDGNKDNNSVTNLEWCTQAYNNKHARDTGLNNSSGVNHKNSKLNEEQIKTIRNSNLPQKELANFFKVSEPSISRIKNYKRYK